MATVSGTAGGTIYGGDAGQVGAAAEKATARALAGLPAQIAVFHDLDIPGSPANIDHAVVVGSEVWLFDSKAWQPGWYVTIAGKTWRKWRPWVDAHGRRPGDKLTLPMARDRLAKQMPATVSITCRVVVHPSTKKGGVVRVFLYRPRGARAWTPERLARWVAGCEPRPPDPAAVRVLQMCVRR